MLGNSRQYMYLESLKNTQIGNYNIAFNSSSFHIFHLPKGMIQSVSIFHKGRSQLVSSPQKGRNHSIWYCSLWHNQSDRRNHSMIRLTDLISVISIIHSISSVYTLLGDLSFHLLEGRITQYPLIQSVMWSLPMSGPRTTSITTELQNALKSIYYSRISHSFSLSSIWALINSYAVPNSRVNIIQSFNSFKIQFNSVIPFITMEMNKQ